MRLALALLLFAASAQAQWQIQQFNTTADLRGIHSLGNGIAWASGSKGTVLRTTDNGTTWQACAVPPGAEGLDFRGIQAFGANTAIIMSSGKGDLSRLYETLDACKSWLLIATNPDANGFWDALSIHFSQSGQRFGYLLGDPVKNQFQIFEISKYPPGEWQLLRKPDTGLAANPEVSGAFAASNSALQTGHLPTSRRLALSFVSGGRAGARIYEHEGGYVQGDVDLPGYWISLSLPVGSFTEASGAFSFATSSRGSAVVVGGDYMKPESVEGTAAYQQSAHWVASETPPHGYRSAVAYNDMTKTWISVGPNGTDASTDDGRNWRPLNATADESQHWNALSLPFVVGPHGRIGLLRDSVLKAKP